MQVCGQKAVLSGPQPALHFLAVGRLKRRQQSFAEMIEKFARRQLRTLPRKRMCGGKIEHKMKGEICCPRCLPALWHELQAVHKESMEKRQSIPCYRQFVVERHARDRRTVPAAK